LATLRVFGALPGTRVGLNGTVHELEPDGSVTMTVAPGDYRIELTRPGFKTKSLRFSAKAGQSIAFGGDDVRVSDPVAGRITIASRSPADATVVLRRAATETLLQGRAAEVPEGDYTLIASAPGYRDKSVPVRIAEGSPVALDVELVAIPQIVRMEGWDNPAAWKPEGDWYYRKGGGAVLFNGSSDRGTIHFTARHKGKQLALFGGGRIRWVANYVSPQNYDLYELDGKNLSWRRFKNGSAGPEKQAPHGVKINSETYRLTLEVGAGRFAGMLFDGTGWKPLPALHEDNPASEGRFGFFLPNNEEMWLSDFVFKPVE
jgi:hypothetical protein